MSSDESENLPTKRERRLAVREKAQQVNAQLQRRRWIRRGIITGVVVLVVAAIVVAISFVFSSDSSRPQLEPPSDGFLISGLEGVAVTQPVLPEASVAPTPAEQESPDPEETDKPAVDIQIYVDYLSKESAQFQLANSEQLVSWYKEGAATLTYYPVATLAAKSNGTKYSQRAAAAAACVGTLSPNWFYAFTGNLFAQQPEPEADGFSDSELAALAIASGVESPTTVRDCIEDGAYSSWARAATERAQAGLDGSEDQALAKVPTVLVNGEPYLGAVDEPAEFAGFVLTVSSDSYYDATPTPTPSPTATG